MKSVHTTTTYYKTYIRVLFFSLLSILFVIFIPYNGDASQDFLSNQIMNVGILYAIIVGFLMSITLARRQALDEYIALELNKIRRIYHLSWHIALANPALKGWFQELRFALDTYLSSFRDRTFQRYEEGNSLFRKATYVLYRLPLLGQPYNSDLYNTLLDATAGATEAREHICIKKDDNIGYFQWFIICVCAFTFGWVLTAATPSDGMSRLITFVIIINLFLVLHLLYEYDRPNKKRIRYISEHYLKNIVAFDDDKKM